MIHSVLALEEVVGCFIGDPSTHTNREVADIDTSSDGVNVTCVDGTTFTGNIIIGTKASTAV